MSKYYLNKDGSFIIEGYSKAYPFFNFLPAVAGIWGIPLWAFYTNRAQCITSFGVHDKNHSILEFYPADRALRTVSDTGFRTFMKIDKRKYYEPFSGKVKNVKEIMRIESGSLHIEEFNYDLKLNSSVDYFTLPGCSFASLVRVLKIRNLSSKKINLEVADGLARVIPFGARDLFLKNLSRTLEAWMHSSIQDNIATFRLLVDPKDAAQTKLIVGANFNYGLFDDKRMGHPRYIVDPYALFGMDTSFTLPERFLDKKFSYPKNQVFCGRTPCSFSVFDWKLLPGAERTFYSLWGGVFDKNTLGELRKVDSDFIKRKKKENKNIINTIKNKAVCISSSNTFNQYIKSTYLDNVLRGGYPYSHRKNKIYYVFSRKHGDLERDYNKFKIFASYFSEGEANYRDVNQNRRVDIFFNPFIEKSNVVYFLNLIKMDGYNPLVVKGQKLYIDDVKVIKKMLSDFGINNHPGLIELIKKGFYLGEIFIFMHDAGIKVKNRNAFADFLLAHADREPQASFGEGYWIDHWHYNLDLIENFLYFYPDKLKELFLDTEFMFWDDEYKVKDRALRYFIKDNKVRQGSSLKEVYAKKELIEKRTRFKNFLRKGPKDKDIYKTNLFVKMISLILNKAATLDPYGIGVEMEADKPGWCDSLNGLPSLFGSSLCETIELKRACSIVSSAVASLGGGHKIKLPIQLYKFLESMNGILREYFSNNTKKRDYVWWDKSNTAKERFRDSVFLCIGDKNKNISLAELKDFVDLLSRRLNISINKAKDKKNKLYYSYFIYEVVKYRKDEKGHIIPFVFKKRNLPLFLEAPVHIMRTRKLPNFAGYMRKSPLYDKKLKMYRLNASLKDVPLEVGRSRVFPRGWLENESVWLHMEYKYLLELLKRGLYNDFYKDFLNCAVCFLDPARYGRSTLENSSFIVSSVYPDKSLSSRGFVARLSGATVELLNIWIVMCLGERPFFTDKEGNLCIKFSPVIKKSLFTTQPVSFELAGRDINLPPNTFSFKLFSSVLVVYHNPKRRDSFKAKVKKIEINTGGRKVTLYSNVIRAPFSYDVREKKVERIDVYLQ